MSDSDGPAPRQAREPEELGIEVSELPSADADGSRAMSWYRQSVSMPRGLVAVAAAVIVALALLSAPISSALGSLGRRLAPAPTVAHSSVYSQITIAEPTVTPSPSPYPTATLIVPTLGAVPASCPQGAALVPFDTATIIPGIGGKDVWIVGPFSGPRATAHLASMNSSDYTPLGWPLQIQIAIASTSTQPITLTGRDVRTGYPIWFQASTPEPAAPATPSLTIDPTLLQSSTGDGKWLLWFGVLYLPGASCYTIQSAWAGGGWTINLAAGQ